MKRLVILAVILFLAAGCATVPQSYSPVIDMKGVDYQQFQKDLCDCRAYAAQISPTGNAAKYAVGGAAAGAALGAVFGAILGVDPGEMAGYGAAGGGAGGAAGGYSDAIVQQKHIINKCLEGRGYKVLSIY